MWGCTPGTFNSLMACEMVAMGYSKESDEDWCIVQKIVEGLAEQHIWYKPCMVSDIDMAKLDGWSRELSIYYYKGDVKYENI